jgi:hypothetical protein
VRLFEEVQARTEELTESLDFQTATSEVLSVISSSASAVEPVLQAIVDTAARLCGAEYALAYLLREDKRYHTVAANNAEAALFKYAIDHPLTAERGSLSGRTAVEGRPVHVRDCLKDDPGTDNYLNAFTMMEAGDSGSISAFAGLVGGRGNDQLANFHLKRLLNGATGTRIALD